MRVRKITALVLALCLSLLPLCALAAGWQQTLDDLSDQELLTLQKLVEAELKSRGLFDDSDADEGPMVWVPRSGSKYHSKSDCSGMKNPHQVTLEEALSCGFTPCKRCNPPR